MTVKKRLCGILVATQLMGVWPAVAETNAAPTTRQQSCGIQVDTSPISAANTGCTSANPAIAVSPSSLEFASVAVGRARNLTFTVQNVGVGRLAGAAEVSAPFRIVAGSPYVLRTSQSQVITVQYLPKATGMNIAVVRLTGGGGAASITVAGSAVPAPPAAPAPPQGPPAAGRPVTAGDHNGARHGAAAHRSECIT